MTVNLLKDIVRYVRYFDYMPSKVIKKTFHKGSDDSRAVKVGRILRRDGVHSIPGFFSEKFIRELAQQLIPVVDEVEKQGQASPQEGVTWLDSQKTRMIRKDYGYSRLLKIESLGGAAAELVNHPFLKEVASEYFRQPVEIHQTIIQKSVHVAEGTGLDWHYDDFKPRFKALVYLHAVAQEQGPFSFYLGSHRFSFFRLLKMGRMARISYSAESIFSDQEMEEVVRGRYQKVDVTSSIGALHFVDTTGVHRGLMPNPGFVRYAIFIYFTPVSRSDS